MNYKLKIAGDNINLDIEDLSKAVDIPVEKIEEIIRNRTSDRISVGYIKDIIVIKSEAEEEKVAKIINKFDNIVLSEKVLEGKVSYSYEIKNKKYSTPRLSKLIGVTSSNITSLAKIADSFDFQDMHIVVVKDQLLTRFFNVTVDGVNFDINLTIPEIFKKYNIARNTLISKASGSLSFTVGNRYFFRGDFESSLKYVKLYGYDGTRYYFGPLENIWRSLKLKCPKASLAAYFRSSNIYDFNGVQIIKNKKS